MIARRKTNLHLPPRMYIYEGRRKTTFYTITHQNKRINLGHDFLEAKRQLLELEQNKQAAGTIGEFMEWYLQHVSAKKSPRTHKDEQASMQRLKAVFGKLFFSELKPHHIAKWHDMRGEDAPIRAVDISTKWEALRKFRWRIRMAKYVSEERLREIVEDYPKDHRNHRMAKYLIATECKELNPWMTLEEFLESGFEGLCWVCYENKHVYDGTYIKKGNYFYHDFEITFDYEDVTDVQPIHKPEPPR